MTSTPTGTAATPPVLETVAVELVDGVATVLLNRPERRNAWTLQMVVDMGRAMAWCDGCDEVRAVVVGGNGPVFCVGADLSGGDIRRPGGEPDDPLPSIDETMMPSAVRKPVIAALHGHAVGIGVTYTLHCDVRFVAEDAKLGVPFVRRGVVPEANSSWLLPRIVGLATALDLVLTGRIVLGREAVEIGLCHRALPADQVLEQAQQWARQVTTDGGPLALAAAKRLLWEGQTSSRAESWDLERAVFAACAEGPDAAEGVAAFLERRPARWSASVSQEWPDAFGATR
jgi:enoyl-CoA hydratase/carnithine racemase